MHAVLLNVLRGIWLLLHAEKLNVDKYAPGSYILPERDWIAGSAALKQSQPRIPAAIGSIPTNLAYYKSFKAAEWKSILELYGAPRLYDRISNDAHHNLCVLEELWTTSIQRDIARTNLPVIWAKAVEFVLGYEAVYYRQDPNRLPACLINVHMLLHLSEAIADNGPCCYNWSYPIERYCYGLKCMVRSHSSLGKSVANAITIREQLTTLSLKDASNRPHPDDPDLTEFPLLCGQIAKPEHEFGLPLSNRLQNRLIAFIHQQQYTNVQIEAYWRRCWLPADYSTGSKASQRCMHINRDDSAICYCVRTDQDGIGVYRFGIVYGYFAVQADSRVFLFAHVRRLTGVDVDASTLR